MDNDVSFGFTCIPVLTFLNGRKLDCVAGAYISSLRPSSVRVTQGVTKLDSQCWRVTVYVNEHEYIMGIEQEVKVMLPEGVQNGDALRELAQVPETVEWE